MTNKVLWIIGSNASGKTTQSKMFHAAVNPNIKTIGKQIIVNIPFVNSKGEADRTLITLFENSRHVGALMDNQCTGTDSLSSKDQIEMAYFTAINSSNKYILIDGIMATFTWCEMIKMANDIETYCVLLHFENKEDNFLRVQERRSKKKNTTFDILSEIVFPLAEKTQKNITGKINGFRKMYDKIEKEFDHSIIIPATLSKEEIHNQILKFIL